MPTTMVVLLLFLLKIVVSLLVQSSLQLHAHCSDAAASGRSASQLLSCLARGRARKTGSRRGLATSALIRIRVRCHFRYWREPVLLLCSCLDSAESGAAEAAYGLQSRSQVSRALPRSALVNEQLRSERAEEAGDPCRGSDSVHKKCWQLCGCLELDVTRQDLDLSFVQPEYPSVDLEEALDNVWFPHG